MRKKNILYLTRTMGLGGTEKVILQLCENFKDEFNNIIVCSSGGIHIDKLKKLGIKHYEIPDFEDKNIINIIKTIGMLKKIIRNEHIDLIHSHHRMGAFYVKLVNLRRKKIEIYTAHNTFKDKKKLTQFALNNSNIIAVGNKVKDNLVNYYGISKEHIHVIYNGIEKDTVVYNEIKELKQLKDKGYYIVGNIGRLSEQKGMKYFIEAYNSMRNHIKNIKFCIIGDGELKDELKEYCKELNIDKDILFLGYRNDIPNIINHCDLIVLSSLWEGLPLIPIETFMQGKTIVATNVDGTSEIVKDGFNGFLVEPRNNEMIKDKIITLYKNNNMKNSFEKNAYKTYEEKFTIRRFVRDYENYYKNLIRGLEHEK